MEANHTATLVSTKKKAIVYIDGFNLFRAVLKHYPAWKWLNIQTFSEELCLNEDVVSVKYFTAWLLSRPGGNPSHNRQRSYMCALDSLPKVKKILGIYKTADADCKATCKEPYIIYKEKKTDVNMAIHMMDDVFKSKADVVVLISGDSDLQPVASWIKKNHPAIEVRIYIPSIESEKKWERNILEYTSMNVPCGFLPLTFIQSHVLDNPVIVPNLVSKTVRRIPKPKEWV